MCINRDVEELLSIWPGLCTFDRLVIWGKLKMRQTRRRLQRPKIIVESEGVLLSKFSGVGECWVDFDSYEAD